MRPIDTPIYDELAELRGIHIPDPLESDPIHAVLAASSQPARPMSKRGRALLAAEQTQALLVVQSAIDPDRMPPEDDEHAHGADDDDEGDW